MKHTAKSGLTLVELVITITIMGIIAAAALMSLGLQSYAYGSERSGLYREGLLAMERMTSGV